MRKLLRKRIFPIVLVAAMLAAIAIIPGSAWTNWKKGFYYQHTVWAYQLNLQNVSLVGYAQTRSDCSNALVRARAELYKNGDPLDPAQANDNISTGSVSATYGSPTHDPLKENYAIFLGYGGTSCSAPSCTLCK